MARRRTRDEYLWVGGLLCLDFSNTQSFRPTATPLDRLESYNDLLDWARFAGALSVRKQRELRAEAALRPRAAIAALSKAKMLREAIYRICTHNASTQKARPHDLDELNCIIRVAQQHRRLVAKNGCFRWEWQPTSELTQVIWPTALSAVDLFASDHMRWVRECSLQTCSALFVDSSKNKKRRWCDMKDCGNRAKARTYRARKRSYPSA